MKSSSLCRAAQPQFDIGIMDYRNRFSSIGVYPRPRSCTVAALGAAGLAASDPSCGG